MARHRLIDQAHSRATSMKGVAVVDELKITFQGVCTSVFGVVPGVPMRTVLPNAMAIRFGAVKVPGSDGAPHNVDYYLMPHIPLIRDRMTNGRHLLLDGLYMKIVNAIPQPFCWEPGGYSLTEFRNDVQLSSNVVFEGNAAAYFDVFCGRVWTEGAEDEPFTTHVSIKTEGPPRISIKSLPGAITQFETEQTIDTGELWVTNLDVQAAVEDTQFDFLLNYLVAAGGIPKELHKRTPGMSPQPNRLTLAHLGERLKALGTLIETGGTVSGWRGAQGEGDEPGFLRTGVPDEDRNALTGTLAKFAIDPVSLDPSCSTVRYP
jgi:hypothetical protein